MEMKLVFLGAPGAGKGTQAQMLAMKRAWAHISTGEMLRSAVSGGTELGKRVKDIMESGKLVPDELMVDLIRARIKEKDCAGGCILDGFPRTVAQATALAAMFRELGEKLAGVVLFEVPPADLEKRLASRRGTEARKDDSVEVQRERLRVYEQQTKPLIEFYEKAGLLLRVSAGGSIGEVQERLVATLAGA